jgi:hypothetical protein
MDGTARPYDILLAYDPDFTGFASMDHMAQPVEPVESAATPTIIGGGDSDSLPDDYYEDFTTCLDRFVKNNPRLGTRAPASGGTVGEFRLTDYVLDVTPGGHASGSHASGGCIGCGDVTDNYDEFVEFDAELDDVDYEPYLGGWEEDSYDSQADAWLDEPVEVLGAGEEVLGAEASPIADGAYDCFSHVVDISGAAH